MICKKVKLWPDRPDVYLKTYMPEDSPMLLAGKPRPAVIICPGGGYQFCADPEAEPVALKFVAMGYHAFVLNYSVYSAAAGIPPQFAGPESPVCEKTIWPAAALDLGKAVLTLREKAEEWGLDADRIAISGSSAGAHNCAMYMTSIEEPAIYETLGCTSEELRVAAAILCYGVYDLEAIFDYTPVPELEMLNRAMNLTLFGERTPTKEQLRALSPVFRDVKNAPPCFLWATAGDEMVPVVQTLQMAAALTKAGVPIEVHVFEEGPHAMSTASPISAATVFDVNEDVAKWVNLAEYWLRKRFALPLATEAVSPI